MHALRIHDTYMYVYFDKLKSTIYDQKQVGLSMVYQSFEVD